MSRRKKGTEHANHERWLVSYADFITLLFAFFVVLYASAQVDAKKMARVAAAIQGGFQQMGVFSGNSPKGPIETAETPSAPQDKSPSPSTPDLPQVIPSIEHSNSQGDAGNGVDIAELKQQLEQALGDEIKKHEVQMHVGSDGLVVSLREVGFFNSGDDVLLPEAQPAITRIAKILAEKGFEIRVEGHTDNVPMHSERFKSNWELSTARATEVASLLVEKHHFNPKQVSVAGYSEYRPVAPNDTEEGRKMNRRVDLVIVSRKFK